MKYALPVKMADTGKTFIAPRHYFHFWYFGVLRLFVGLAQIAAVIWCAVLLMDDGFSAKTMRAVFGAAGITTLSLLLFRLADRGNDASSNIDTSNCTNGNKWNFRGSAISKK